MTTTNRTQLLAREVVKIAIAKGVMIATAESCTGGLIAGRLTDVSGSSAVVDRGFVTYSNEAKNDMLGVPMALIEKHGAVSGEVARAMAAGALKNSRADLTVSVTGIAGPTGGTVDKPVGLVWFGVANSSGVRAERRVFTGGSRGYVRTKTVEAALRFLFWRLQR